MGLFQVHATHLLGGEMTYECLGNDTFKITLTLYQNCEEGAWWDGFDSPPMMSIYDLDNDERIHFQIMQITETEIDTIELIVSDTCQQIPSGVCIHTQTFSDIKVLPENQNGYMPSFQRCCYASEVLNIEPSDEIGINIHTKITPYAINQCSDSPKFRELPPAFFCVGIPFSVDQSGMDENGDSLVYSISQPFKGTDNAYTHDVNPPPPPYTFAPLTPTYSLENMFGEASTYLIDENTGLVEGVANVMGLFVTGVTISEYRNGILLSEVTRLFVYNVGNCTPSIVSDFEEQILCDGLTVTLQNQSQNMVNSTWIIEEGEIMEENITYPFQDIGSYEINLIVEAGNGCVDTSTQHIFLSYPCGFDIETEAIPINPNFERICSGEIGFLELPFCEDYTYVWQQEPSIVMINPSGVIISPQETTTYIVDIYDGDSCHWISEYTVEVSEDCNKSIVNIPNVFTPNNDGLNDDFGLISDFNILEMNLKIFSRWGELIYTSTNIDDGWNGTYKGKDLPSDIYVWIVEYSYEQYGEVKREIEKGDVALMR